MKADLNLPVRPAGAISAGTTSGSTDPGWDEAERIAALRSYDVLDSAPEAAFDDFVRIAAHVCDTPMALVSLVDSQRQWFKAELGVGLRETARDISICSHAIRAPGLLVVPDTTEDGRFADSPLVRGAPHLRFYAGAVLETPEGLPVGTLCVLDHTPRPAGLNEQQRFVLAALGRQVMAQLELRRTLAAKNRAEAAVEAAHGRIEETLKSALVEKELMMQEVHHRVKNSLQMVQNLLMMQARGAGDAATARQLREGAARVSTFASLHHQLYLTSDGPTVQVVPYLEGVIRDLREGIGATLDGRGIVLSADAAQWPSGDVPTLGLVMTELVTNALKYGAGIVRVSFRQPPTDQPTTDQPTTGQATPGQATLSVEDEGAGLPADFEPTRSQGLGMRLVTRLLSERGGGLKVDRASPHTRLVVRLPRSRR